LFSLILHFCATSSGDIPRYHIDLRPTGASLHERFAPVGHRVEENDLCKSSPLGDPVSSSIFQYIAQHLVIYA